MNSHGDYETEWNGILSLEGKKTSADIRNAFSFISSIRILFASASPSFESCENFNHEFLSYFTTVERVNEKKSMLIRMQKGGDVKLCLNTVLTPARLLFCRKHEKAI